jgi:hypothetical protein
MRRDAYKFMFEVLPRQNKFVFEVLLGQNRAQ